MGTFQFALQLSKHKFLHSSWTSPTKGIYVDVGGNLDIHGQDKLSWTKLTETLTPVKPFGLERYVPTYHLIFYQESKSAYF